MTYSEEQALSLVMKNIKLVESERVQWHFFLDRRRYLETIRLCPPEPSKVLDLGYSQVYSPALREMYRYDVSLIPGLSIDFERDRYPFADSEFDGALCCEVIEHYTDDPMFSMIELNRVIRDGGFLVLTTPNVMSWEAVYRILNQEKHPSRWPFYAGALGAHSIHVREYMKSEIEALLEAAGFRVDEIYTMDYGHGEPRAPLEGYSDEDRGETIFCRAVKVGEPKYRTVYPIYGETTPYVGP